MAKTCLECGEKLVGRSDKKFCDDACRNAYNNRQNRDQNNMMRNVHNLLRRNYRILEKLNPTGKTTVLKNQLLQEDFQFDFVTNLYTTKNGTTYFFVYDLGYLPLDRGEKYLLVKRKV